MRYRYMIGRVVLGLTMGALVPVAQAALVTAAPMASGSPAATQLYASATASIVDQGVPKSVWVAAILPNNPSLYFRTAAGWAAWSGGTPPAALFSTSADTTDFDALGGVLNLSALPGAQVYVGFAQSWSELLANGDYALVYTVPQPTTPACTAYVAPTGSDSNPGSLTQPWQTLQHAVDAATPGMTICARAGTYAEQVNITHSGSAAGGYLSLQNYPGESPIVDGSSLQATNAGLFTLTNASYVQLSGFEVRNYTTSSANVVPAGIFIQGAGDHLVIANNHVHDIKTLVNNASGNAFGIAVYGTQAPASIHTLTIANNEVDHLMTGSSESMSLNGNVQYFSVVGNRVHDNSNIGIDLIGYEGTAPDPAYDRARDGVVSGNTVYNISSYGNPAYGNSYGADGLYVDGGTRIIIERNSVSTSDIGIEVTSEHAGKLGDHVIVRNNLFFRNNTVGMSIGGYDAQRGGTDSCEFVNNTLYQNDTAQTGSGEININYYATNNAFENNIVYAGSEGNLLTMTTSYTTPPAVFDANVYFAMAGAAANWQWNGQTYTSLSTFQQATAGDAHSQFADPQFVNGGAFDFQTGTASPAIGKGLNLGSVTVGSLDYAGNARLHGSVVDVGAYQH